MTASFTPYPGPKTLVCFLLVIACWLGASVAARAQGYIYLHNRSFNEESGINFTYSVSGGPTTVSPVILNDQPATLNPIAGLGGGAGGGLWALAGTADASGNYAVYYRAPNTGAWVARTGRLSNIDGGAVSTRIGIAQVNAVGRVFYDNGTTETDVTGNLTVSAIDVSDNWQGVQYAVLSNNQVWRRSTAVLPAVWTLIPGISARSVDAIPNTTQIIYKSATTENVIRVNNDGTGSTTLGFPANVGGGTEIAVSENGLIVAKFGDYAYRWTTGTTWTQEVTSLLLGLLTGGTASQIWARLPKFLSGISERIYSRTETGLYLTDENVRTSPNDNSALIAVAPGTYTITETPAQGWDLNGITFYESQTPSSANVATNTASVIVSTGEIVHVVFENALVQTTAISNVCSTSATFTETFGTGTGYGGPLTGLTGYHYANGEYGFGYYSLANTTALMGGYAGNFPDHTGNTNGRMLAVDATSEPGVFYRRRFTGLQTGSVYTFSAWAMNVNTQGAPDVPNISFEVYDPDSGTLISSGNSGNINAVGVWQQTSLAFTATQGIVDLVLRNNTTGTSGNDLAIDDISFGVAIPPPTSQKTDATCSTPGSITISSPSGSGYQYSINGTTYQTSPIFASVPPGSYSVTARYTASTGCVSPPTVVTIALTGQASFTTTLTSTTIGSGNSATLTASSSDANSSYRFSTGLTNTTGILTVSPTTIGSNPYSVTTTSSQGCTAVASATVTVVPIPVPTSLTISGQPNPGGTNGVTISPASFTGTTSSGTITAIRYTAFPTNTTNLTIGTTVYTSATFPAGGVTATVGTSVRIDPVDGAVTAGIPFRVISNSGVESTATGTVGVPFLTVTDFCNSQILFFNEDFGAGTGFGPPLSTTTVPGYTYTNTDPVQDGFYSVLNNPDLGDDFGGAFDNVWLHGPDHTGNPNGRILLINGSNPGQVAYTQAINGLTIGRFYTVRAYVANLINPAVISNSVPPNLIFQITNAANSTTLAQNSTGNVPTTSTLTWVPYSLSFTATTTSVNFRLISNAPAATGNDFALDDIQFFEVIQPVLSATSFTSVCPATSANISGITASNQPASTTLTWHSSATATTGNRISNVTALTSGTYYAAFFDGTCYTRTSPFVVLIVPCANPDAGLTISAGVSNTVVANVAANDFVNGQPATLGAAGNATVAQTGTYPTGVTLNTTTGSLSVAAGTAPGSYTVTYQLCDKLSPVNCTTALATFTVTPTVSGTVLNDANGLTDNTINGTAYTAGGLFAILTDAASGTVIANAAVISNGTYSFTGITTGTYQVRLSTTTATVGSAAPAVSLPAGYTSTGEGTATAGDGTPNGITSVTLTATASLTGVNFGIEQLPVPTSSTLAAQANPGGLNGVSIPPASFTGTDADGTVTQIHITAFPSNVTSLTIGNTLYIALTFPAGGVTVATGTAVRVDPVDGNVTVVIPFRVLDNAGQESTATGSVSVPFTGLTISGTVFDDGNGLTDNTINGTGTNAGGGLYANLVDAAGNTVATQLVPATGVYSFSNVAVGILYSVRLSTTTTAVGTAAPAISLPTGWTFTGEGTAAAGDGTPNGSTQIILTATSISGVNFGIDQLPVPTSSTLTAQANPGGTNGVAVPPASFTGTDADGTIVAVRYTTFPTNVTSLTIGSTVYTSANFPAGGVTATVGTSVRIDPVDGAVTAVIPFRVIDNANAESTITGSVSVPFTYIVTASPDAGTVSSGTGGTAVANVAANDVVNGQPATLGAGGNATVAPVGTFPTGITLNTTTGSLSVAQGTAPGSYTVTYQLCDRLTTPTCATTNAVITVTPSVTASPDAGTISSGTGGTAVANVAANDVVNGQPATLGAGGNATVAPVGTFPTGITLNTTTGSLSVAQGTAPGSYTVTYQLCDRLTTPTCATTTAIITVTPSVTTSPDAGTVSSGTGGTAVANVAANDVVNGQPATLGAGGNATVAPVGTYPTGITLNIATGSLNVAQGTAPGSYTVSYQLCDRLTTPTCATTTAIITVTPSVTASPDAGTISSGTGGTAVANVAANDVVNGQPATLGAGGNATVMPVGTYPTGITLNTTTGSLSVAQDTAPGSYTVTYQLCDRLTTPTCATATAVITVAPSVTASPDAGTVSSGTGGTAVANVAANDVVNGQPATLGAGGNATVMPVGTYPTGITLNTTTGSLSVAQDTAPGSYTVTYQLCDRLTTPTCATATVIITVAPSVTASPDAGTVSSGTGGTAVANVAANDVVNGQPATLGAGGNATVAPVGTFPTGITLNTTTGSLSVAQGTAPGSYTVAYQLCDRLTTPTCATTTAIITVTPSVTASPDAGTVSSGTGGTAVANVAANDVVNGQPATLGAGGNATVAPVGTYPTGVTLNTTTGSLSVAQGTAPGSYTVTYQLCDRLTTPTCATTTATITVAPSVTASPDAGTVSSGTGGTVVANVAANDVVNGQPATLGAGGNATVAPVGTYPAGVTLNTTTGSLSVAPGTTPGSYTVTYQLCDRLTPVTCATSVVSFTITPGISGTVLNDANGLTDNTINGSGTNAGGLFVILVNSANTVVTSVSVSPAGTYRFDNIAPGTYNVRLSTTTGTTGSAPPAVSLPANWTSTGEGTTPAGDGLVNGITSVTVGSAEVTGVNFGIEQLPTPISATLTAQANPGSTNAIAIPPSSLTGTDPDGTVVAIRYVSFPTNVTSISIDGVVYTSANFPAGGVTAATGVPVYIDPVDGTGGVVTPVISFRVVDNAGVASATIATVTVPFTCFVTLCPPVTGQKIQIR